MVEDGEDEPADETRIHVASDGVSYLVNSAGCELIIIIKLLIIDPFVSLADFVHTSD